MWQQLFRSRNEHRRTLTGKYARPRLEMLESRLAPAVLHWSGIGAVANMTWGINYVENPPGGPQAGDTIIFDGANGASRSAIADPGLPNLASIQFGPNYSGSLTIDSSLTVTSLTLGPQTITIDGGNTLSVHQAEVNGGTIVGAGALALFGAAGDQGSMEIHAATAPTGLGMLSLIIDANSSLGIADTTFIASMVTNFGTINWTDGGIFPAANTVIDNEGKFNVNSPGNMGPGGIIDNFGAIVGSLGGTMFTDIENFGGNAQVPFEVTFGTFTLGGTMNSWAPIQIDDGATLDAGAAGAGAGGGAGSLNANNGTLINGAGTLLVSGGLGLNVAAGYTLQINTPLRSTGAIAGPGDIQVNRSFDNVGGAINNTQLTANQGVSISTNPGGTSMVLNNTLLNLYGTSSWVSGEILLLAGSVIQNYAQFNVTAGTMTGGAAQWLVNMPGATITILGTANFVEPPPAAKFNVSVETAGNLYVNGRYANFSQTFNEIAGIVDLGGGILDLGNFEGADVAMGVYNLLGGTLVGQGMIVNGDLINSGGTFVALGYTYLGGDYTQGGGGTFQLGGPGDSNNQSGYLAVVGTATLAGTLSFMPGFIPGISLLFHIIGTDDGVVGRFGSIPPGWDVEYPPDYVTMRDIAGGPGAP